MIPYALTLALGHPRQALRWRAVYAIVHALIDTDDPDGFLEPLLDALDSTDSPRWLSVREWMAFALEHVSLRKPGVLRGAMSRLIPHAISRELPHAKIRHHLKQVLLAVEASFPGTLGAENLANLERVNRPVAVVYRGSVESSLGWDDWEREAKDSEDEERLTPDSMDTVPYWYQPLARCFAGDRAQIQRAVLRRATDWMASLGISRSAVEAEHRQVGTRYDWPQTSNDHGSQPRVELLRLYGERHALYLVAGEFIDSVSVVGTTWAAGDGNEWDDWADDLRGADSALPARLLDAPPPRADNYGVFASEVDIWRRKEEPGAFTAELEVPGEPEWVVVAGDRHGFEYDRTFQAEVASALVESRTADALARLLESGSREAFLPFFDLYSAYILPNLDRDLEEAENRRQSIRGEHDAGGGRFVLKAWLVRFYQEAPLHDLDPFWPGIGRHYGLPAFDVMRRLGWRRDPVELLWRNAAGQPVARCDLWRRSDSTFNRSSDGFRLAMRREAVSAYAQELGLDVIFSVRLRRQARSHHRTSGGDEFDPGTTRCFRWSALPRAGGGPRN